MESVGLGAFHAIYRAANGPRAVKLRIVSASETYDDEPSSSIDSSMANSAAPRTEPPETSCEKNCPAASPSSSAPCLRFSLGVFLRGVSFYSMEDVDVTGLEEVFRERVFDFLITAWSITRVRRCIDARALITSF